MSSTKLSLIKGASVVRVNTARHNDRQHGVVVQLKSLELDDGRTVTFRAVRPTGADEGRWVVAEVHARTKPLVRAEALTAKVLRGLNAVLLHTTLWLDSTDEDEHAAKGFSKKIVDEIFSAERWVDSMKSRKGVE